MSAPQQVTKRRSTRYEFEALEERVVLATSLNEIVDFGDSWGYARYLGGDTKFDITGYITSNDVDYFAIEAGKNGKIRVVAEAQPLSFDFEPYLDMLAGAGTEQGYLSLGWYVVTGGYTDPLYLGHPHIAPERALLEGEGTLQDGAYAHLEGGTEVFSEMQGTVTIAGKRVEWNYATSIYGTIAPANFPNRYAYGYAISELKLGVANYQSNYSGTVNKSYVGERFYEYNRIEASLDFTTQFGSLAPISTGGSHYWEFIPDTLQPFITILDSNFNVIGSSPDGELEVDGLAKGGIYYVVISRDSRYVETSDEDRWFSRPYEVSIEAETDIELEKVIPDYGDKAIDIYYRVYGHVEPTIDMAVYWASGPDLEDRISAAAYIVGADFRRGEHIHSLSLSALSDRPENATHLVVMADRLGKLLETDEENNDGSIQVINDPKVEIIVGPWQVGATAEAGPVYKYKNYAIWVTITNNSLVEETLSVELSEILMGFKNEGGNFHGTLQPFKINVTNLYPQDITLPALTSSDETRVGVFLKNWDWIPEFPPIVYDHLIESIESATVLKLVKEAIHGELVTLSSELAQKLVKKRIGEAGDAALDIVKNLIKIVLDYARKDVPALVLPTASFAYRVRVLRDGIQVAGADEGVDVEVGEDRKNYLSTFRAIWASMGTTVTQASNMILTINPNSIVTGLSLLHGALTFLEDAELVYMNAVDPPDPDFQTLVQPRPISVPNLDDIDDEVLRRYFETTDLLSALSEAMSLSINKADGAALAGNVEWEANQLLAASAFHSDYAIQASMLVGLQSLLDTYFTASLDPLEERLLRLETEGLPPAVIDALSQRGWPEEEIEAFRQLLLDPEIYEEEFDFASQWRVSGMLAWQSSLLNLADAIRLRTKVLGHAIIDISPDTLSQIEQMQVEIGEELLVGTYSHNLPSLLETYLQVVREEIVRTNNFTDLEGALTFGYLVLLQLQLRDHSFEELESDLVQLATDQPSAATAVEEIRAFVHAGYEAMQQGEFATAVSALDGAGAALLSHWGISISAAEAARLMTRIGVLRELLVGGYPDEGPVAVRDQVDVFGELTSTFQPQLNDLGLSSTTRLKLVNGPTHGSVVLDDGGTAEPDDDTFAYSANPDRRGGDTLRYAVIDTETWRVTFATVNLNLLTKLEDSSVYFGQLLPGDRHGFVLDAQFGTTLELINNNWLESMDYWIETQEGRYVQGGRLWPNDREEILLVESGSLRLWIEAAIDDETLDYSFTSRFYIPESIQDLTAGQTASGTIAAGEQLVYRIHFEAGDQILLDSLDSSGPHDLRLVTPNGATLYLSAAYDSSLYPVDETGEYLVILRMQPYEGQTKDYAFRFLVASQATRIELGEEYTTLFENPEETKLFLIETPQVQLARFESDQSYLGSWSLYRADETWSESSPLDPLVTSVLPGQNLLIVSGETSDAFEFTFRSEVLQPDRVVMLDEAIGGEVAANSEIVLQFTIEGSTWLYLQTMIERDWWESSLEAYIHSESGSTYLGSDGASSAPIFLQEPGDYFLVLTNVYEEALAFDFQLIDITAQPPITAAGVSGIFESDTDVRYFWFPGVSGQTISIFDTGSDLFSGYWELQEPIFWGSFSDYGELGSNSGDIYLFADGPYVVTVNPYEAEKTFAFRIEGLTLDPTDLTLNPIGSQAVQEGQLLSFTASVAEVPAGQTLVYSLAAGAPEGAAIDPLTGVFSWTPTDSLDEPIVITIVVALAGQPDQSDSETILITVANQAPTLSFGIPELGFRSQNANGHAVRGHQAAFVLNAIDVSAEDQAAGFTFSIDWDGDGNADELINGPSGTTVEHVFADSGTFNISVWATDKDGSSSAVVQQSVKVVDWDLRRNAATPERKDLVWGGTSGNDAYAFVPGLVIKLSEANNQFAVLTSTGDLIGTPQYVRLPAFDGWLNVSVQGGDDLLFADVMNMPLKFFGGDGNDVLIGGRGSDTIDGGDGNDIIFGGTSDGDVGDLLIGGIGNDFIVGHFGADTIYGGSGSDLLFGGSLNFPNNLPAAVYAIQAEWTSDRPLQERVDNLMGVGSLPRNNGTTFLQPGTTVLGDGEIDFVFGEEDEDWLIVDIEEDLDPDVDLLIDIVTYLE